MEKNTNLLWGDMMRDKGLERAQELLGKLRLGDMSFIREKRPELELDLTEGRILAEIQYDEAGHKVVMVQQGGNVLSVMDIDHVIFNDPATIVIFSDGTKEVVKTTEGDVYQPDLGVAMALVRKLFGSRSQYKKFVKQFILEEEEK